MQGKVYLIGAGPGDVELLTLKAVRTLGQADVALIDDASGLIGVAKVPTTPRDFAEGVLAAMDTAMERYEVATSDVGLLSHATTVVTNAERVVA